ncbi:unnamed protein product [Peniophora sp. CBMAI 1063]|nr:unnamed protein product [Peniophora sp. CBMAI 1063]
MAFSPQHLKVLPSVLRYCLMRSGTTLHQVLTILRHRLGRLLRRLLQAPVAKSPPQPSSSSFECGPIMPRACMVVEQDVDPAVAQTQESDGDIYRERIPIVVTRPEGTVEHVLPEGMEEYIMPPPDIKPNFVVLPRPPPTKEPYEQKRIQTSAGRSYVGDFYLPPGAEDFPFDKFPPVPPAMEPWRREFTEMTPWEALRLRHQEHIVRGYPPCPVFPGAVEENGHIPAAFEEGVELADWTAVTHPDGTLYFYNERLSLVTECYIVYKNFRQEIEHIAAYIEHCREHIVGLEHPSDDWELVVQSQLDKKDRIIEWAYYYVDHTHRRLYWIRPYLVGLKHYASFGFSSPDHNDMQLEQLYWEHVRLYPRVYEGIRRFPPDALESLIADLTWCAVEAVVDPARYTGPFSAEESKHLLDQLSRLLPGFEWRVGADRYVALAAKTKSTMCRWRWDNFHGQPFARTFNRGSTVRAPEEDRPTWLLRLSSPLLFYAPISQLQDILAVYVDGAMNAPDWIRHVQQLLAEWREFTLYATVLLAANVSFLAIPDVVLFPDDEINVGGGASVQSYEHPLTSPSAILSSVSMLMSVGCILLGLMLVRQHRGETHLESYRSDMRLFMQARWSNRYKFQPLAIVYSLPFALLMWSVAFFLTAVMVFFLKGTDWPTRSAALSTLLVIGALSAWCIQMGWSTYRWDSLYAPIWHTVPAWRVFLTRYLGWSSVEKTARRISKLYHATATAVPSDPEP